MGIDPDCQRLQVARKKHSEKNLQYLEGSGEDIPGEFYDIVFSNYVLHWCQDKEAVFKQVEKSLKKGGKFGFVAPADVNAEKILYTPANMFSSECRQFLIKQACPVPSSEYLGFATANNFSITYFRKHLRDWKFRDVNEVKEFHMTHSKGHFDSTHFDIKAMKEHYGEGEIVITLPHITVIITKM